MALPQLKGLTSAEDIQYISRLQSDGKFFIETMMNIRSESKGVVPFFLNPIQVHFHFNCTGHDLILKPRRLGFSTYLLGRGLHKTISNEGFTAFIMAHDPKGTNYLFEHLKIMYESIPDQFKPKRGFDNTTELTFPELHSKISVAAAGATEGIAKKVGRSEQVNYLLMSEYAYYAYPKETWTAISQTVPYDGEIYIESTANGHNDYYDRVIDALHQKDDFKLHFYRWFDNVNSAIALKPREKLSYTKEEKYLIDKLAEEENTHLTPEQIKWRRWKIRDLRDYEKFKQEYPENLEEAFLQSDRPWLNPSVVSERIKKSIEPLKGNLRDRSGNATAETIPLSWRVFLHPIPGHRYVVGADCAEGNIESHFDSADVLDVTTGWRGCL